MKLFDGKLFAKRKEKKLINDISKINRQLSIVSFLVGDDIPSRLYVSLKKKVADRIGVKYDVVHVSGDIGCSDLRVLILSKLNDYDGVMIQLPLPNKLRSCRNSLIDLIPLDKDVDGLRWEKSGVVPATVKAILSIVGELDLSVDDKHFVVVGSKGVVGKPLVHFLKERGFDVVGIDIDTLNAKKIMFTADVLISCTGVPSLIKASDIKDGVVLIDVGISKVDGKISGDIDKECYSKASFVVPVPGGVGPVTIVSLFENLVLSVR